MCYTIIDRLYLEANMKVILASKSPRRKELMEMLGVDFDIIVSNEEEIIDENLSIEKQAQQLSYIKAKSVFDKTIGDRIVIGSDTMVVGEDGKIYGKPTDRQDAIKTLKTLKNTKHNVITGLCILVQKGDEYIEHVTYDLAEVHINDMTNEEIAKWVDTGEAYDKAGSYAVQGKFCVYISKINGNYSTIVGLPIHKVYNILKEYLNI